ncbi:hypothetical protein DFJ74DRAFT_765929 [Hyaloraphidium curvatum]|nr:hypothetical protein DFJ74DRAFT_765929 [Hyaloraphidium curvatum]
MASQSPMPLLREAQMAIGARDYARAVALFTQIRRDFGGSIHVSLPLLSRAICFLEMGDEHIEDGIRDCEEVLSVPDVRIPDGIVAGVDYSHAAAAGLLSKFHAKAGREGLAEMNLRMMRDKQVEAAGLLQQAQQLREKGNDLLKKGKTDEAVAAYEAAVKADPTNELIFSNLSFAYLKSGKADRAELAARQCTLLKPSFAKGWYRLGMALMQLERHPEAMAAFHSGLKRSPDDQELKSKYLESATHAEKAGYEKVLMGMLVDLARDSFDVREWWRSYASVVDFVDPKSSWQSLYVPKLGTEPVKAAVEAALRAAVPDCDPAAGPTAVISSNDFSFPPDDVSSYLHHALLEQPLVAATYLLPLLKEAEPKGDWHVVISFNFNPPKGGEEASQLYTALVDRKKMRILDWEGLVLDYRNAMGKGKMKGDREMNGAFFRAAIEDLQTDKILYTCGDSTQLLEFCKEFYASERRRPADAGGGPQAADAKPEEIRLRRRRKDDGQESAVTSVLDSLLKPDNLLMIFGAAALLFAVYVAYAVTSKQ